VKGLLDAPKYIAIGGCLGAGKTTFATTLAREFRATTILEDFNKNPFWADFYEAPQTYVGVTLLTATTGKR